MKDVLLVALLEALPLHEYALTNRGISITCVLTTLMSTALDKQAALDAGIKHSYGLNKKVEAVSNVRNISKLDMKLNDALPDIKVDPETYTVTADGTVLTCTPATTVPLSRNYFLF